MTEENFLLGKLDNLAPFTNQQTGRQYEHMTYEEFENMALKVAAQVMKVGRPLLLSMDSGSLPLALVVRSQNPQMTHIRVKAPREIGDATWKYLSFMLTPEEKSQKVSKKQAEEVAGLLGEDLQLEGKALTEALRAVAAIAGVPLTYNIDENLETLRGLKGNIFVKANQVLLQGTQFSKELESKAVMVEEFVTSATVLTACTYLLLSFNEKANYELVCYNYGKEQKDAGGVWAQLYGSPWNQEKAYPYENRIDLLGFYYTETAEELHLQNIKNLADEDGEEGAEELEYLLRLYIKNENLVEALRVGAPENVKDYLDAPAVARWLAWKLERDWDETSADLYYQLFEMYAPSWSPLTIDFHLGFTGAFEERNWGPIPIELRTAWARHRGALLAKTARAMEQTRNNYWTKTLLDKEAAWN